MDGKLKNTWHGFWGWATRTDVLVSLAGALVGTGFFTWIAQQWTSLTGGNWPASIFYGVGFVCVIVLVGSFGLIAWRYFNPLPNTATEKPNAPEVQVASEKQFSADPEAEALDKQAYNEIVAFSVDYLLPACEAQIDLQNGILIKLCSSAEALRLACSGMRTHEGLAKFWNNFELLGRGLTESPGPIIKFEALIGCIFEIERSYKTYCDQVGLIVNGTKLDCKRDRDLRPLWEEWRVRHNALVAAYEPIKRDSRFGKLFRPARESHWGTTIEQQPDVFS